MSILEISKITQRRFILGKQGLYPGRRWQGKAGVVQALRAGSVVQVDPLNVVARSHDIVLYGRVLDYLPALLDAVLYQDRDCFDYGGTVMIHPMTELPYWRVVMARKREEARRVAFAAENAALVTSVYSAIRDRGPLSARDFKSVPSTKQAFRSGKLANQALYYLWLAGEIMTHSRKGLERLYDLPERIAPPDLHHSATPDEADSFFALKIFQKMGMLDARGWRNWFAGTIERRVAPAEARGRLDALLSAGIIVPITLQEDPKTPRFMLAEDLPLLQWVHAGMLPDAWQPVSTSTSQEMIFLAPLEIVSTRGRALPLFDFTYLWEVYKPQEKRRWGYYTLPILYHDRLVARLDPKLERGTQTLVVKGFWLEDNVPVDDQFIVALARGFKRFMRFVGAEALDLTALHLARIREGVQAAIDTL